MNDLGAGKHVLCIDDDDAMIRTIERTLVAAGYRVTATTSPREALAVLLREPVQAFVADLQMPEMGGDVILAMAAQAAPRTVRVLLTSQSEFTRIAAVSVPYAVHAFVAKSDLAGRLVPILRQLLAARIETDEAIVAEDARALAMSVLHATTLREYETVEHCLRVAAWSKRLAAELELSTSRQLDVELGALLHDIGLTRIPEAIVLKPSRLDEHEWKLMREHPDLGAALLAELPPLRRAIPVVQCHHERCDGRGYPRKLSRTAIPFEARIFQIADTYESIVRGGPYRRPRSDQFAREEIAANVGAQFDPEVHEAFFRIAPAEWTAIGDTTR